MQNPLQKFGDHFHLKIGQNPDIQGLQDFKNRLEKDYFSEVVVRTIPINANSTNLIIELDCNFSLVEILSHLQKGNWGATSGVRSTSPLINALDSLRKINSKIIDIEEFSLYLKDSSIIIKNIYKNSIQEQLNAILGFTALHYVHFTKKMTETPFEIYVPVFGEDIFEKNTQIRNIKRNNNHQRDYFKFWGLYFESEEDALIYNLKDKSFIPGDLLMLND
ncbi:hypothetical protein [Eudoraea chungangensis]|uniref:hypothetical protein n=1 Tax=Eudoraea chungangensis TaxID=1481905 RepID=UPI0023EDD133|nr:hypothetical protein [Eudoraea chungangensis]